MIGAAGVLTACGTPTPPPSPAPTAKPSAPEPKPTGSQVKPAAPEPTPASPVAKAATPVPKALAKWKEGTSGGGVFFETFVRMNHAKGFDREGGLDVEYTQVESGSSLMKAIIAGELDSTTTGAVQVLQAIETGADIKVVGSAFVKVPHLLFVRGNIARLSDLIGKSYGIGQVGDFSYTLLYAALKKENLDPEKVNYVSVGGEPAKVQALLAGKIDSAALAPEFEEQTASDAAIKTPYSFGEQLPQFIRQLHIVSGKTIRERPDAVTAYLGSFMKGIRYGFEHKAETLQLAAQVTGKPAESFSKTYDQHVKDRIVDPNLAVAPAGIDYMQSLLVDLKQLKGKMPPDQIADFRFRDQALASLGPYRPA